MKNKLNSNEFPNLKMGLDEMKKLYDIQLESVESLNKKILSMLSSASLIISLISVLKLTLLGLNQPTVYWCFVIISFTLYFFMIILTLLGIKPINIETPIKADFGEIKKFFIKKELEQIYINLLNSYIEINNSLEKQLKKQSCILNDYATSFL